MPDTRVHGGRRRLNALIVEDDPAVAHILSDIVGSDVRFHVAAVEQDMAGALAAKRVRDIDCAFVDIHLASQSSGYGVACALAGQGIRCAFVTGAAPPFPMPEFAVGCILKPFGVEAVYRALDMLAGHAVASSPGTTPTAGFVPY